MSCVSAGLNASNATTHHLPFAEASLSHKHRKRVGSGGDLEDSAATGDSAAAEEGDLFVQKPPASAEQVASTPLADADGMRTDGHLAQACHRLLCMQHRPLGRQCGPGQHDRECSQAGGACIWLIALRRLVKFG